MKSIATSQTYLGRRIHGCETYDAIWPPLVDEAAHLAAVRVLTDPARKTTRPGRQKWLLSYLALCDPCGGPMHRIPNRDNLQRTDRYQCGRGCTGIGAVDLDELVTRAACRRLDSEDRVDLARVDDSAVIEARVEVERLRDRLNEWRDSVARGETSPASLARIEAVLLAQIAVAQRRAVVSAVPPALVDLLDGDTRYEEIRRRFDAYPVAVRREIINILMTVRVRRADHGGRQGFEPERVAIEWRMGWERTTSAPG